MAVVAVKSTPITNADAAPVTFNSAAVDRGGKLNVAGVVAPASGDSIASVYRMFRVRSSDRIDKLELYCSAITTCAADIGLYKTAKDGGAVVDADFFASAQSLASALTGTNVTHESGVYTVANREKKLWEALGLTADPQIDYDVALTLTAAAGSAGTVALEGTIAAQS